MMPLDFWRLQLTLDRSEKLLSSPERIHHYWIFTTLLTCCKHESNFWLLSWFHPQSDLITTVHGWGTVWANAITAFSTASLSHCLFWHLSFLAVSSHILPCVSIFILYTHTNVLSSCPTVITDQFSHNSISIVNLNFVFPSPGSQAGASLIQAIQESPARYPFVMSTLPSP